MPHLSVGGSRVAFPDDMSLEDINKVIDRDKARANKLAEVLKDLVDRPESLVKIAEKLQKLEEMVSRIDTVGPVESSVKQMLSALTSLEGKIPTPEKADFSEVLAAVKSIKIPKPRAQKKPKGIEVEREDGIITGGVFTW